MGLLINGEENKIEKASSASRTITFRISGNVACIDGPLVVGDKIKLILYYQSSGLDQTKYSEEKVFEVSEGETTIIFNTDSRYPWYNKTATFNYSNKTITYNSIDASYILSPEIVSLVDKGITSIKDFYIKLDGTVVITGPIQIEEL